MTKQEKQILALQRQAKKYPKCKDKIRKIKDNRRRSDWLSQ